MKKSLQILILTFFVQVSFGQKSKSPLQFRKQMIAAESFEAVGVFDVNKDGHLDIVSGYYWYKGPTFKDRVFMGEIKRYGEYWDSFSVLPMDVDNDGWTDFISGGWWGKSLKIYQNPKNDGLWKETIIDSCGNVETTRLFDVDGDGFMEICPNNPSKPLKYYRLENGNFKKYSVAETQGHGLGFGDINGDGRGDFISANAWYEAPKDLQNSKWIMHKDFSLGKLSIPIIVTDVNKDDKPDFIAGQGHGYGLDWYEQSLDNQNNRTWKKHSIDSLNSQYHEMVWTDLDGDGQNELITGKRFRAHDGNDLGANDPVGLYYFTWDGQKFVKNIISFGVLGVGKGTGIQMAIIDLQAKGKKDIVVAGKDGLFIFWNEGK